MEKTQVLFTSLSKGVHHVFNESSYLDKDFFMDYPMQNYKNEMLDSYARVKQFKDANMHQVKIRMIQVSWIKDWDNSKQFFKALIAPDNLILFKNRSIIELIDYMWTIC